MTFSAGTRLGTYEILGPLGAGGMGEVYRARDLKLKRDVALKVLPDAFASDAARVERFQREAEILASLNHPHIATIHDLADAGGTRCLILELVEGETLHDLVRRGPLALDDAFRIATQIAEALEAAHEKGITHRDLKPANIQIAPGGNVKVLDFGLAKLRNDPSNAQTMMATEPGTIIGTAAYMSPEQAKGHDADRTSDVWAFGCVLYEMLTGHRVFGGDTGSEILAEVLKTEPDWRRLPGGTPDGIKLLLRRCLQKERRSRLHDMADVRILIDEAQRASSSGRPAVAGAASRRLPWIAAGLAFLAAVAAAGWALRPAPPAAEMRVDVTTPPTSSPASMALSPDGQKIVFVATSAGLSGLWLRSLDAASARPLADTNGAQYPFWAPNSRSIGFFADRKLKKIDIVSGSVQTLADSDAALGGSWNRDDTILFAPTFAKPIFRISATGGEPVAVTRLGGQAEHRFPHFLPDGRHFLYVVLGATGNAGVYVGRLDADDSRRVLPAADGNVVYASSGQLLFVRQGTLYAQNFDLAGLTLTGNPYLVAEQLEVDTSIALPLSVSDTGTIAYRATSGQRQLAWLDRSGKPLARVGDPVTAGSPALSHDGRRVAMHRLVGGRTEIWMVETERGVFSRVTSDGVTGFFPLWSPDDSAIVFSGAGGASGVLDLFQRPAEVAGRERLLLHTAVSKAANDWSPDGRYLLYVGIDPKTSVDLWAMAVDGRQPPFAIANTRATEALAQFSPDGKWIAYHANDSGRFEIYLQPFPGPGPRSQISTAGGAQVRWPRGGKELFYVALDGRLMAVPVELAPNGQPPKVGTPAALFATNIGGALQAVDRQQYVVSPDGQRFLMNTITEDAGATRITVILNWKPRP